MGLYKTTTNWLRPLVFFGRNIVTLIGAVLTTSSGITLVIFWGFQIVTGVRIPPYFGILFYLILPGIFFFGLIIMPVGVLWRRYQLRAEKEIPPSAYPKIDLGDPVFRRALYWVGGLTVLNVVIMGAASYRGVEYMDSVQFCGLTCHTVMLPEYTAYTNSPHARVECVSCHIGPGASWFVRSKLSGVQQVFAVLLNTYPRPIPSPVENLRPARETCEQCHWPEMFEGDSLLVRTTFSDDEKNTPLSTVLLMKIGGTTWDRPIGIHGRHLDPVDRVRYITIDKPRQEIPVVTYVEDDGKTEVVYRSTEIKVTPEELAQGETRIMDCVDCHNRPTHTFRLAADAVDTSMSVKHINPDLPYIKKKAVEALQAEYPDRDAAANGITSSLTEFYKTQYPDVYEKQRQTLDTSIAEIKNIYLRNVFPDMNVTWGTYPNNLGHINYPGCFRCHDGSHVSEGGKVINDDCSACHTLLAIEEENPQILKDLEMRYPRPR